jgi:beta-1,4-mannosyltransferase
MDRRSADPRTGAKMPSDPTVTSRLIAFPKSKGSIPYTMCLYAALEALGVQVIEGYWAGRWLLANVRAGDVLHIHWPSFLYFDRHSRRRTYVGLLRFVTLLEIMRARGARVVWTAHNLYPHEGGRGELTHRIARRAMARRANPVLAHGPTAALIVAREFSIPMARVRVIKHGHWIDFHTRTLSAAAAREQLGIEPDRYVYSFVGNCRPYKNLERLVGAFAELNDNSVLLIAGSFVSESYRARIDALLQRLPSHRWRIHSEFIADEDIHRYVLAGNVLVLPYAEILTSGSAMLGLSFGRPVIAPNAGGLRDMVNSASGLLYDADDANGLLEALRHIRTLHFSERAIIDHARTFDWLDAARVLAQLLSP